MGHGAGNALNLKITSQTAKKQKTQQDLYEYPLRSLLLKIGKSNLAIKNLTNSKHSQQVVGGKVTELKGTKKRYFLKIS